MNLYLKLKEMENVGKIRIGRLLYNNGKKNFPSYEGYKRIEVMTKSTPYGDLGPYVLKNDKGQLMENIWQFAKVYKEIPKSKQRYSQYSKKVIWDHPAETHVDEKGNLTPNYWNWRKKGMDNPEAVRYPVGRKVRSECLYAQWNEKKLNYIDARKEIYFPVYAELVKKEKKFNKLIKWLKQGKNLLIIEVDGPHQESLNYYKERYNVDDDFIKDRTILVNQTNMDIMINDTKHAFGHGYCLGMALLNLQPQ